MSLNLTINTIEYNDINGINIVFIGDGFTASQQSIYNSKVQSAINGFFTFEPFDTQRNKFNIYSIPTISNEAGISYLSHPKNPIVEVIKDTYLGAYFNEGGMIRLTSFTKKQEVEEILTREFKNRVFLVLICNTGTYGGSGMFPDNKFLTVTQITMETQYNKFNELMMHEFGHSFCGLADEYGGNCTTDKPDDFSLPEYDRPNVTSDNINNRKWDGIISNPQYILGANYCNSEWYRSSNQGLMRGWFEPGTLDEKHNELGIYLTNRRIEQEVLLNRKTTTYIDNDDVDESTSDIHPKFRSNRNIERKRDIRINSDVIISARLTICRTLYINKGCSLTLNEGCYLHYDELINNGEFIINGITI